MTSFATAQILAEVRMRLRSPATLVAALALLVITSFWIPDPDLAASSLSWTRSSDDVRVSGTYNAAYIGTVSAMLASSFLTLIGFYLVAGSVSRDRRCGVGAILAATPLSNSAYLFGKFLAHWVYLLSLAAMAMMTGILVFVRYGQGGFSFSSFLWPSLLLTVPGLAFTAALALLFDVAPVLRGRGGLVSYLFVWAFVLFLLPLGIHTGFDLSERDTSLPFYDPPGNETLRSLVYQTVPDAKSGSISMGLQNHERIERIEWGGFSITPGLFAARAAAILWASLPLGLAILLFDRFDPARLRPHSGRARIRMPPWFSQFTRQPRVLAQDERSSPSPTDRFTGQWTRIDLRPTLMRGLLAECRLIWDLASWIKWPLLLAAVASAGSSIGTAAFLLMLAPVLSEVGAREDLHGTRSLVLSQPAVPSVPVLWKAASVAIFLLVLGMPRFLAALLISFGHGMAFLAGLLFIAGFSVGVGSLSRGGKAFSGIYTALWYLSWNGGDVGYFDFSGAFTEDLNAEVTGSYLLIGMSILGVAALQDQRRRAAGSR